MSLCNNLLTESTAWGGLDTLHILAGVPSTLPLLEIAGFTQTVSPTANPSSAINGDNVRSFQDIQDGGPSKEGLDKVVEEARACSEINFVGTALALACFVSLDIELCFKNDSNPYI